jgi:hypothetical protein
MTTMVVEEVIAMVFLTILTLTLLSCCAYAAWPGIRPLRTMEDGKPRCSPDAQSSPVAARSPQPESLEGILVAQLVAAEITLHQYLRAMERIAARDDARHPLAVPPETGSDAGQ